MKKLLLLASSVLIFTNVDAQQTLVDDDMEAHPTGSFFGGRWSNWSLSSDPNLNLIISEDQAASGTKSGLIGPDNGSGGQDVLLRMLQTHTSGIITSEWKMYIPDTAFAYYNLQETNNPGDSWGYECYTNRYGADDTLNDGYSLEKHMCWMYSVDSTLYLYAYVPIPTDEWFTVKQVLNISDKTVNFYVNDEEATYFQSISNEWPGTEGSFGAFNFYSAPLDTASGKNNTYYIDDVKITKEDVSIKDVNAANKLVNIYPNPVTNNTLYINAEEKISAVSVYNVVGQMVLSAKPNHNSTVIGTENLAAGIYTAIIEMNGKKAAKEFVVK